MRSLTDHALSRARQRERRARAQRPADDGAGKSAMAAARARGPLLPKADGIRALMAAGDMRGAILAAARLPELDRHRDAILGAKEAIMNPGFQRQIKRDPDALIAAGEAALKERFP